MDQLLGSPRVRRDAGAGTGSTSPATPRSSGSGQLHLPARLALPRLRHRRVQRRQAVRPVRPRTDRRRPAARANDDRQKAEQSIATGFLAIGPEGAQRAERAAVRDGRGRRADRRDRRRRSWADGRLCPLPRPQVRPDPAAATTTPWPASSAAPRRATARSAFFQSKQPSSLIDLPDGAAPRRRREAHRQAAGRHREADQGRAGADPRRTRPEPERLPAARWRCCEQARRYHAETPKLGDGPAYEVGDGTPKPLAWAFARARSVGDSPLYVRGELGQAGRRRVRAGLLQVMTTKQPRRSLDGSGRRSWPSGSRRRTTR